VSSIIDGAPTFHFRPHCVIFYFACSIYGIAITFGLHQLQTRAVQDALLIFFAFLPISPQSVRCWLGARRLRRLFLFFLSAQNFSRRAAESESCCRSSSIHQTIESTISHSAIRTSFYSRSRTESESASENREIKTNIDHTYHLRAQCARACVRRRRGGHTRRNVGGK
jgi:hypothetical protein